MVGRPEPPAKTMLVLLRDRRKRVSHVVIGPALLDADWAEEVSLLMPDEEALSLSDLCSNTPREARQCYKELCDLGDIDPDPADFEPKWLPPAAGLRTVNWLQQAVSGPRSRIQRLLNVACVEELKHLHAALALAEASGVEFHLVGVGARESRQFAGREIIVGPENNEMHPTRSAPVRNRGPRG